MELKGPRPNFALTLTDDERKLMGEHAKYWEPFIKQGIVAVFGPFLGKAGSKGIVIVEADSEESVQRIIEDDPTMKSGRGFAYDISMMRAGFVRN